MENADLLNKEFKQIKINRTKRPKENSQYNFSIEIDKGNVLKFISNLNSLKLLFNLIEFNYHSIIVCPVSKEICNENNPPMILVCGHIISESSAKKLANVGPSGFVGKKIKCPICPKEQDFKKLKKLSIY
jgi:hypothetical protein